MLDKIVLLYTLGCQRKKPKHVKNIMEIPSKGMISADTETQINSHHHKKKLNHVFFYFEIAS